MSFNRPDLCSHLLRLALPTLRSPLVFRLAIAMSLAMGASPALAQRRLPNPVVAPSQFQANQAPDTFRSADFDIERDIRYLVYTTPASDRRLAEVRRFVPEASFGDLSGDLVIQAGLFESEADASNRLITLAAQGITTDILQVQVNPPRRATQTESESVRDRREARAYYVVIPGDAAELNTLAGSLRSLLGETPVGIFEKPHGLHVAIGPFVVRDDAELVEDLLRDRDVRNARVYYDRGGSLF